MSLFWRNGYESTCSYVEKEMGINQLFMLVLGATRGFLESLKCYKRKLFSVSEKLQNGRGRQ
jgi:hypothetical protein